MLVLIYQTDVRVGRRRIERGRNKIIGFHIDLMVLLVDISTCHLLQDLLVESSLGRGCSDYLPFVLVTESLYLSLLALIRANKILLWWNFTYH